MASQDNDDSKQNTSSSNIDNKNDNSIIKSKESEFCQESTQSCEIPIKNQKQRNNEESISGSGESATNSEPTIIPASPPTFISFDNLMRAADSVNNMKLAHEIAIDNDFKFSQVEPPANTLEKNVKDIVTRAFWDLLRESFEATPPDYSRALKLLEEAKATLKGFLAHRPASQLHSQIDETLDLELIRQQLDRGCLDIHAHVGFVLATMKKLCAPVRDEAIEAIAQLTDPVDIFRETFHMLDLMKMDLANFSITQLRPYIQQNSIAYERMKFDEFLATQKKIHVDGLQMTRSWIKAAYEQINSGASASSTSQLLSPPSSTTTTTSNLTANLLLSEAYVLLLKCPPPIDRWPETVLMDETRFREMSEKSHLAILLAALNLIVSVSMTSFASITLPDAFRMKLKRNVLAILGVPETADSSPSSFASNSSSATKTPTTLSTGNTITTATAASRTRTRTTSQDAESSTLVDEEPPVSFTQFPEKAEAVADGIIADICAHFAGDSSSAGVAMTSDSPLLCSMRAQLIHCVRVPPLPNQYASSSSTSSFSSSASPAQEAPHKIRQLLSDRVFQFLNQSLYSSPQNPVQFPPGTGTVRAELTAIPGQLLRLTAHNRQVFSAIYERIIHAATVGAVGGGASPSNLSPREEAPPSTTKS